MKNAYIHIPFCKQKCNYCSFVSYPRLDLKREYLDALKYEIKSRYKGEYLETLYFGGGTPSLLTVSEFESIVELFNVDERTEITAEFNPETAPARDYPINRISIGCQTFDDKILEYIGRKHKAIDVINCVNSAQKSGYKNISLDLIYGLPFQTIELFEQDLKQAISLNIQHISLYGLKIDNSCYFYKNKPINLPDNDIQADMYLKAEEILTSYGFEHYEVSNFSKPNFYSRHNLNYWNNRNYYGFGAAAHGYEDKTRYANQKNLEKYIKNPLKQEYFHILDDKEILEEEIFLGLRKVSGINIQNINKKFGIDFEKKYKNALDKYSDYLEKKDNFYKLTLNGIMISNNILSEFLD